MRMFLKDSLYNDLLKYKSLQGYEKEEWLKSKRREYSQVQSSKELQLKLANDKQNTGSPFFDLLNNRLLIT